MIKLKKSTDFLCLCIFNKIYKVPNFEMGVDDHEYQKGSIRHTN